MFNVLVKLLLIHPLLSLALVAVYLLGFYGVSISLMLNGHWAVAAFIILFVSYHTKGMAGLLVAEMRLRKEKEGVQ